jgi:ABC-type dipeptide/oligopeptide/nickel transport system permease component
MWKFLLKRALRSMIVLLVFLTVNFFLVQAVMPGDYAILTEWGEGPEGVEAKRHELGLDLPTWQRYVRWLGGFARGDLGLSFMELRDPLSGRRGRVPVVQLLALAMAFSCLIYVTGTVVAFRIGEWLGRVLTWRCPRAISATATLAGIVLYTAFPPALVFIVLELVPWYLGDGELWREWLTPLGPPEVVALFSVVSLAAVAGVLALVNRALERRFRRRLPVPVYALLVVGIWVGGWSLTRPGAWVLDLTHIMLHPIAIYVLISFGGTMLIMRSSMKDTLYDEYVFVARAKGLPEHVVRDKHAARNALVPVLSRLVVDIPYFLSGLVIVEDSMGWRRGTMGSLLFNSVRSQDVPVEMGCLLAIGVVALVARLALDVTAASLDPRIRLVSSSSGNPRSATNSWSVTRLRARKSRRSLRREREQRCLRSARIKTLPGRRRSWDLAASWKVVRRRAQSLLRRVRDSWRVFAGNRLAVLGLVLIGLFAVMAAAQPMLMETVWKRGIYDPMIGFDPDVFPHPSPPSLTNGHLLGTDSLGRDVLSMLLAATPPTFVVALTAAVAAAGVGTLIGAISAYHHGKAADVGLGYLADAFLILPAPIVMVILGARYFEEIGPFHFGLIYGLIAGVSSVAIVLRAQGLKVMTRSFIQASRVAGAGGARIVFTHLIPHMLPLAAVQMMMAVAGAVIAHGFVAFAGVTTFHLNWGSMVYVSLYFSGAIGPAMPWHQLLAPGIALSLFSAAFYLVSRGLHEVVEPRLRER